MVEVGDGKSRAQLGGESAAGGSGPHNTRIKAKSAGGEGHDVENQTLPRRIKVTLPKQFLGKMWRGAGERTMHPRTARIQQTLKKMRMLRRKHKGGEGSGTWHEQKIHLPRGGGGKRTGGQLRGKRGRKCVREGRTERVCLGCCVGGGGKTHLYSSGRGGASNVGECGMCG